MKFYLVLLTVLSLVLQCHTQCSKCLGGKTPFCRNQYAVMGEVTSAVPMAGDKVAATIEVSDFLMPMSEHQLKLAINMPNSPPGRIVVWSTSTFLDPCGLDLTSLVGTVQLIGMKIGSYNHTIPGSATVNIEKRLEVDACSFLMEEAVVQANPHFLEGQAHCNTIKNSLMSMEQASSRNLCGKCQSLPSICNSDLAFIGTLESKITLPDLSPSLRGTDILRVTVTQPVLPPSTLPSGDPNPNSIENIPSYANGIVGLWSDSNRRGRCSVLQYPIGVAEMLFVVKKQSISHVINNQTIIEVRLLFDACTLNREVSQLTPSIQELVNDPTLCAERMADPTTAWY